MLVESLSLAAEISTCGGTFQTPRWATKSPSELSKPIRLTRLCTISPMHPEHRPSLLERNLLRATVLALSLAIGYWLYAGAIRPAIRAADYSAHAALTKEICLLLAAVPPGQAYPESLTDLHLTFPDGGDHSLLERFEYNSKGTSCTLKTVLTWDGRDAEVISRSFPVDAADPW